MSRFYKFFLGALVMIAATLSFSENELQGCTAFQLTSDDGAPIYFRSMEFGYNLQSNIIIVPKGITYTGTAPDNKKGLAWDTIYGFVGMNQNLSPNVVSDGMNEKGLVVGLLYLPGFAKYETFDESKVDQTLGSWELGAYLLGTCSSIEEVKSAVEKVVVAEEKIPGIDFVLPVHYYIADAQGKVVVLEYVDGKRHIYDNPVGVLTNSPPFDWHLNNLSNFVNLSPVNVAQLVDFKNDKITKLGEGTGLLGIPGDYTPPSRFVRAALYSQWAIPGKTALDTVNQGFHIINTFDIFFGIVREKSNSAKGFDSEYTQWVIAHDRKNLKTFFRTYEGLEIEMVDFKNINFNEKKIKKIIPQRKFVVKEVTQQIQE